MKIDGRAQARKIYSNLEKDVTLLEKKGIVPHLVIVLVGSDISSKIYIRQKVKKAGEIGIKITFKQFPKQTKEKTLLKFVNEQNADPTVHGIIIQRPVPGIVHPQNLNTAVIPEKDVDGFHPESKFDPPLALAVMTILDEIKRKTKSAESTKEWLGNKNLVFIGRGEAGGRPVISHVEKLGLEHSVIHSHTQNPEDFISSADIIFSAVGKKEVVTPDHLKKGVILIGIGLHKEEDGKMHGDYKEEDIQDIVSFYTPTPSGVGPVNVAMLLSNVVKAASSTMS